MQMQCIGKNDNDWYKEQKYTMPVGKKPSMMTEQMIV